MIATIYTTNNRKQPMNSLVTGQRSNQLNYSRIQISRYNPNQNILHQKNIKKTHSPKTTETRQHLLAAATITATIFGYKINLHFLRTPP